MQMKYRIFFFFSSRRRHTRYIGDWSSDVCSSDLVRDNLAGVGFDPSKLDRVRAPIGLEIGAETPEEIAVSIMAEMIAVRRGGRGLPMSEIARTRELRLTR